jgi:H+/Cl- antiporter ClcA
MKKDVLNVDKRSARRFPKAIGFFHKSFRFLRNPIHLQTAAFLTAAFAASLTAVIFTQLFKYGEEFFRQIYEAHPLGIWLWTPACFVASRYFIWKFAPAASGSGIPQVLAAKDEKAGRRPGLTDRLLSLRIVPVKIASAVVGVAGGAAIGREGPTLQIGASVYRAFQKLTSGRIPNANKGLWITAGAATGLAAAFNTPLGGIVFAIEELRLSSFQRFRTVLLSSIIVGGLVSQWLVGSYLYLGTPSIGNPNFMVFPFAILVGVAGGVLGSLFG